MMEAFNHFSSLYQEDPTISASYQEWVLQQMPVMFDESEIQGLNTVIKKDEIANTIKSFALDKSPGPKGWTVEFFLHFFDIMVDDIIEMVNHIRTSVTLRLI